LRAVQVKLPGESLGLALRICVAALRLRLR